MKFLITIILLLSLYGCGGGSTTGNPIATKDVNVRMQDQQPFAWIKKISDQLISPAYANVSGVKFCFKRIRFKVDSSSAGRDIELMIGEVNIDPTDTNLVTVAIPEGTYRRVEFDLQKECDGVLGKPSVSFTNNSGPFSTLDTMTIKFDGSYVVNANGTLNLNIDALLDALDLVTNDNQIKVSLENAPGDF